jgi:hypothetical protein
VVSDVAIATDGTTVFTGNAELDGAERAIVRVRPPGGPVGPAQPLGGAPTGTGSSPQLATGPAGHVAAIWYESRLLRAALLAPGATSFGAPVSLGDSAGPAALDVDSAGTAHVLWSSRYINGKGQRISTLQTASVTGDALTGTASVAGRVEPEGSVIHFESLDIAVGDGGAAIAGWNETTTTFQEQSSDTATAVSVAQRRSGGSFGATWLLDAASQTGELPNGETVRLGSVVMNASGDGAVVWRRREADYTAKIKSRTAAAGTFGPTQSPAAAGGMNPAFPVAGIDDAGRLHVAWTAAVEGVDRPQHSQRTGNGNFGPVETLTTSGDQADAIDLAVAPSGETVVTWSTSSVTVDRCGAAAAHAAPGGPFGPPAELLTAAQGCSSPIVGIRPGGDGVVRLTHGPFTDVHHEAAGLDAAPPSLADVQIPATATAGMPSAFAASATDLWGPLRYEWDFGDGTQATGSAADHAFDGGGDRTVTVTVSDGSGQSATASRTVAVAAGAAPQIGSSGTIADLVPPTVSRLRLARRVLRFRLSEAGPVTIAIQRRRRPRRVHVATLRRPGVAGPNRVRLGRRLSKPGRYRVTVRAADAAGNASRPVAVRFRIRR